MDTATEHNDGSIDAVAASLLAPQGDAPQPEVEETEDDTTAENPVDDVADETDDATDEADAEEADAEDDAVEDDDETDDAAEEDDAAETADDLIPVKVGGKVEMRTLDELKQAYSGQAYIQARMQENAAIRKEAEAVYAALQQEREQIAAFANQLRSGQAPVQAPTAPSRDLLERDPIGYIEAQAKYQEDVAAYEQTMAQLNAMAARQQEMQKRATAAALQEQMQLLTQALPDFADADKGARLRDRIVRNAVDAYGFEPSELMSVADSRHVRVLHDAMLYRQMMAERGKVEKKVQQARPVVKPGAKRPANEGKVKKAMQVRAKMKQTGDVDDVARFLLTK